MTMIDALEPRRMLAADTTLLRVKSVTADNRGEILVQFSERAVGVKGSAFQVYTAGADGKLYTSDDKRETVAFTYSKAKKQLRIIANIKKDVPYRLKLDGKTRIKSEANGSLLDGDFVSASRASGDGVAGGNYEMQVKRDTSKTPSVKMRSNLGEVMIRLRGDVAPISVNAFLTLANKGKFDRMLVTRTAPGFVIQMGSVQIGGNGQNPTDLIENSDAGEFPEELPRVLSNTRGTLSFARGGDMASNQFFFNLSNNNTTANGANNLDIDSDAPNDSVFTPFAEVTTSAGFDTIDAIASKQYFQNTNAFGKIDTAPNDPDNYGVKTGYDAVPVLDAQTFLTDNTFRPARDGIIFERTAVMSLVVSKHA